MKILAMYLPQYHEIIENNMWWGEGYTEWNAVKSAKPLYRGHNQPRIPLDGNYYDLLNNSLETWLWQAELAKKYNVHGFCIYHYWFNGKQLLEKPAELLRENEEIDLKYCFCWANETWTKTWYGLENEILMKQEYGNEKSWEKHFEYLLPFFKDSRYIKIRNKPMFNIYHSYEIEKLDDMLNLWNKKAKENGFDGIFIVSGNTGANLELREDLVDAYYNFEPGYSLKHKIGASDKLKYYARTWTVQKINKIFNKELLERKVDIRSIYKVNTIDKERLTNKPVYLGTLPMWDNTPRRSYKGLEYVNSSPQLFLENLKQIKKSSNYNNEDYYVYLNAWNEWGEGCYIEPDEKYNYEFLEAIKKVFEE
jgi:hypothetical protein